ncbi:MAG TPA: DciA family protein [Bryobacteraceae bacterium]|nr:DciA family protein [Bryobacteraceae bacterium]
MERASRLIRKLHIPGDPISAEEVACAAWPPAVGKKIAAHTRAARMVRTRLIVEVEDAVWQRQLFALTGQILRNLDKQIGSGVVEEVEFRVVPARRPPGRARQAEAPLLAADEADQIADPVLRSIYKRARKRAQA